MPRFSLGRLFWKFLLFFFLAHITVVLGVGLAIWTLMHDHDHRSPPPPHPQSPLEFNISEPGQHPAYFPPPPPPPGELKLPVFHLVAGCVASLFFAALLAAYVTRPIQRLRTALQEGANGRLSPGLTEAMGQRNDELTDLCRDFDHMARQLAQLMEGQRRLLHDVSHELRAPLARLTAVIGLIRQQPGHLDDCLPRLERESERMDRLLGELLTLSRLESGMVKRADEPINLSELLHDVVSDATPEAAQAACEVELDPGTDGEWVKGDAELLHRVFDNLLRNALRHAASGKWVRVSISSAEGSVCVRVEDHGPGILSSESGRIFEPFYRSSPNASDNGHGLGLAIARQIVEAHGGTIEATNRPEGGLRVSVALPVVR
jgi:two-component system OmpR family sensor kinase